MMANDTCPLISVLIPAYNHERYVAECIRSVLAQDWPQIELLVVDDGSTDATLSVIESLRERCESRFVRTVILTQKNQGLCRTMNRLKSLARGRYVAIIASDDRYLPGAFSALVEPMEHDAGVGLTVGVNYLIDSDGRRCYWARHQRVVYDLSEAVFATVNDFLAHGTGVSQDSADFGTYSAFCHSNHVANGYLIRRSCYELVPAYRNDAPLEDFWLHLHLSKVTKYVSVNVPTFEYRWHGQNTMASIDKVRMMAYKTFETERDELVAMHENSWLEKHDQDSVEFAVIIGLGRWLRVVESRTFWEKMVMLEVFGLRCLLRRRKYVEI